MKNILLFAGLILCMIGYSQVAEKRMLQWEKNIIEINKESTLGFSGAIYNDDNLPVYFERFENVKKGSLINVAFENVAEVNSTLKISELINDNFEYNLIWGEEKKKDVLYIEVMPLRRNKSTNKIEKLLSFTINIENSINNIIPEKNCYKTYISQSVLKSGTWKKIKLKDDGVYKISYEDLISMGFSNPSEIKLFGNGGKLLSESNNDFRYDDLVENPIYMFMGSDNIFNAGDYILFYGKSPVYWSFDNTTKKYSHALHKFSDYTYYFLTTDVGQGLRIQNINNNSLSENYIVSSFDDYRYYEKELVNLIQSGSLWFGENFNIINNYDFPFTIPDLNSSELLTITTSLAARSSVTSSFVVKSNNQTIQNINMSTVNMSSYTAPHAILQTVSNTFSSTSSSINLNIAYSKPNSSAEGWLNYIEIVGRRFLKMNSNQMAFRDNKCIGVGNVTLFNISNSSNSISIWDVTDPISPKNVSYNFNNNTATFKYPTDSLIQFIAFNNSNFLTPEFVGTVTNQNLHGLPQIEYIIISNPLFLSYANQLAELHYTRDNLSYVVVTPEQIYNEFSSGSPDVSALRDFVKMFYDKSTSDSDMPKYLLLFGDGSYNNRSTSADNTNFILTYQSSNSLSPTESFVTDDFFGLLGANEGGSTGFMDIGVGRLPVKNTTEAQNALNKIKNYLDPNTFGDWRNVVCFIADDEDANQHMLQANSLASKVDTLMKSLNVEKIFLDAYQQISTPSGQRYPDVNLAIENRIRKGALIMNYTGHGNELGLGHERIIGLTEINSWDNKDKLPLFVTATCEFSRFDDYSRTSAGEQVFLNPNGGAIALLSTTRLVYSTPNFILNDKFYDNAFVRDNNNQYKRLGEIMRLTKVNSGVGNNKRNFTLLGDPALRLAIPNNNTSTLTINSVDVSSVIDTIKALSKVTISGKVIDVLGNDMSSFNGTLYPTVYDKVYTTTTLANDGGNPMSFKNQNNILYRGKASIINGNFEFSFVVPKDINYSYGYGKISYYYNNTSEDGHGNFKNFIVGGTADNYENDIDGPEVNLFMNNFNFVFGGLTDENPTFIAKVNDSFGINTASGIGHDITAILDNQSNNILVLNDYYEADLNSYQSGEVRYKFRELSEGIHSIQFKVWDVYNNSSDSYIEFIVAKSTELVLSHVLNYPNPFTTNTNFYFEHNVPNQNLDVIIQIFTISGKLVKTLESNLYTNGYRSEPINWDGKDDYGNLIGRGVYLYRIKVKSENGNSIEKFEKLVILK